MSISNRFKNVKIRIKDFDWILFFSSILLFGIGFIVIYSTTLKGNGLSQNAINQLMFFSVGIFLMLVFMVLDYKMLKSFALPAYIFSLLLLILVFAIGSVSQGATRWFSIGPFQIQPSEFTKIFLIIVLAKYFSARSEEESAKHILISGIYVFIPLVLVLIQPDLGTALVFLAIWTGMIIVSNIKKIYLYITAGISFMLLPIIWQFLHDYQKKRILTFLNPQNDPFGSGYNVIQSITAVGSGRVSGRGLGYGSQSQLNFLPAQHTDFIFASTAEALGLLGAALLLSLFLILLIRAIRVAKLASDSFGMFLAVGIIMMFGFQVLVNVGMNIGIMPVTGIPLPLVSYGGSSILTAFIALGILQSIIIRHKKITF